MYTGERFCRAAGCLNDVSDVSEFHFTKGLRKHYKKYHPAIYDALDDVGNRGGRATLELRAHAMRWYDKIIDDCDKREAAMLQPHQNHPSTGNEQTENNHSSTALAHASRVHSIQSSRNVTPLKRRYPDSESEILSPLTEIVEPERNTLVSVNREVPESTHTNLAGPSREQQWNSSSTMSLVTGAFHIHNTNTPDTSMTDAFPGGQTNPAQSGARPSQNRHPLAAQSPLVELISILPSFEVSSLLVDTYFDRAHWFMLIFHQDDFRKRWQQLYQNLTERSTGTNFNLDFTSTLLMAIVIGLQYVGPHRRELLAAHNVDAVTLKDSILNAVRAKMMDIISLGSLEAAQTCILLGTYYLYHGDPGLAWPICGCGLRIAQALNLHRKIDMTTSGLASMSLEMRHRYETRKRCWWAIYEIETFCSMSYGYPQAIRDVDCDVHLLEPLPVGELPASVNTRSQDRVSLLSYKYLMSKLSILTKTILNEMYGANSNTPHRQDQPCRFSGCVSTQHHLAHMASHFDAQLHEWKKEIPPQLHLNNPETTSIGYASIDEMDRDIGASGPKFENYIYQLQALALEIAYENAKILVHRPLLEYKRIPKNHTGSLYQTLGPCRDAALKISEIGSASIFSLAADTYAAAFIGIHTFTAGVTLCILASIEPLTLESHKSKMGLHRLLGMQRTLAPKSQLAAQGLAILERLTKLVMEKELKQMLARNDGQAAFESAPREESQNLSDVSVNDFANFDFMEDPTISQALSDFDKAISGRISPATDAVTDDLERQLFPELWDTTNRFAEQQAWIWGGDCLAHFPAFAES
ncbi:fungal-specific transcription factor domain-containing protein [Penicillium coprophilum]|uniref:fungal-specific transcription factor domain-containing protein n=1 Tax=Penicillium coprophilum TaxID=36646 RepID=UPI0023877E44|nr:fungal-specific transcription factor domain-containing protein [Penicillium coprophilum]KAJ5169853.1 fungal-specific transcription factor domain-containing protein [Penicillium coprophilum]